MIKRRLKSVGRLFGGVFLILVLIMPGYASAYVLGSGIYKQLSTPFYEPGSSCSAATTSASASQSLDLNSIASKYALQSIEVKQLGGAVIGNYNANQPPTTPASTMKLIIVDTVLRDGVSLSKNISIHSSIEYRDGSGNAERIGSSVTVGDAIDKTLRQSGNTSANVLMYALGGVAKFTQKAQGYGYTHTDVKGYYSAANDGANSSTISDEVAAMDHLFSTSGAGYSKAQSDLEFAAGPFDGGAATGDNYYGVADDANKWAGTSDVAGNVAKLKAGGQDYIVGLYINKSSGDSSAQSAIKNGTADIAQAITGGAAPGAAASSASACCNYSTGTDVTADSPNASNAYKSGLQPPYIVEQFAINVLKDLAQKKNLPESSTVTSQHVLALATWAIMEGGDINNSSLFNLYNSGQRDSGFTAGAHTVDGLGSYVSFDAGVEEIARNIDDGNHNGMLKVLLDSGSTAEDFAHAESYSGTNTYPGTMEWAGAAHADPSGYESKWRQALQSVKSNYKNTAALVIGTPAKEFIDNTTNPGLLSGINGGGFTSAGSGGACLGNSQGAAAIAQEALSLSWPDGSHGTTPTAAYQQAYNQYDSGGAGIADCGSFVGTVMHVSKADPDYPPSGTAAQEAYVRAHPEKYDVVDSVSNISDLQPGDILIVNQGTGSGAEGHTYIFVGSQPPNNYNEASASLGTRAANLGMAVLSDNRGNYLRARLK